MLCNGSNGTADSVDGQAGGLWFGDGGSSNLDGIAGGNGGHAGGIGNGADGGVGGSSGQAQDFFGAETAATAVPRTRHLMRWPCRTRTATPTH